MGKKKGADIEKKLALQAKKSAKAEKAARKRLLKQQRKNDDGENDSSSDDDDDEVDHETTIENMDLVLIEKYIKLQQEAVATKATTTIIETTGFPLPRANATLTVVTDTGNRKSKKNTITAYLFGGEYYDGLQNVVLNQLYLFELNYKTNDVVWKQIVTSVTPPPRCAHSAVYYNRYIYVFGGELASSANDEYYHYKDLWKYNIDEQVWTEIGTRTASSKTTTKTASSNDKKSSKHGSSNNSSSTSTAGTVPTARSGHTAVVWKNYMILFGGFFEVAKSKTDIPPRWYNDIYVMDLRTEQWLEVPHSKLTLRPEPRSRCNACILQQEEKLLIHGGFSKLSSRMSAGPPNQQQHQLNNDNTDTFTRPNPISENKVHTDTWLLNLKPLLNGKQPVWERFISSTSSQKITTMAKVSPTGRCGTACLSTSLPGAVNSRVLMMGGVVDKELHHHQLDSIFYNDLYVLDINKRKFFPLSLQQPKQSNYNTNNTSSRNNKGNDDIENDEDSDNELELDDEEDETGDDDELTMKQRDKGWDLNKLIESDMLKFIKKEGEAIEGRKSGKRRTTQSDSDDEEEMKENDSDNDSDEEEEEKEEEKEEYDCKLTKKETTKSGKIAEPTITVDTTHANEPLPRIKAILFTHANKLYVYGGLLEVGDRELTLDDLWCLDLKKRQKWECIYEGSMHQQVWKELRDDDTDTASNTTGTNTKMTAPHKTNDDDDDDADDSNEHGGNDVEPEDQKSALCRSVEENIEDVSDVIRKTKDLQKQKRAKIRQEIRDLVEENDLENSRNAPRPNETLIEFYARTSAYWNEVAAAASVPDDLHNDTNKERLKDAGFALCRSRYEELEPIMDRIKALTIQSKREKESSAKVNDDIQASDDVVRTKKSEKKKRSSKDKK